MKAINLTLIKVGMALPNGSNKCNIDQDSMTKCKRCNESNKSNLDQDSMTKC